MALLLQSDALVITLVAWSDAALWLAGGARRDALQRNSSNPFQYTRSKKKIGNKERYGVRASPTSPLTPPTRGKGGGNGDETGCIM